LIVAAERQEMAPLARRLRSPERLEIGLPWALSGQLGGLPVALAAGRSGRANAISAVERAAKSFSLRGLVSTGWCGALDPGLHAGQVVLADRVLTLDGAGEFSAQHPGGRAATGPVLTVDHFVGATEEKRRLRQTGAIAVEMEAAAVAVEAQQRGIPFYCVRAVSDVAEKELLVDFNRARLPGGQFSAARAAAQAGLSPRRWSELLEMWRNARAAAEALGEFLGSCRFDC